MRLSLDWLGDMVTWNVRDPHEIARRITLSIAEVEEVVRQGALLDHCCVGKITAVLPHPNADKLRLVDVETDRGTKRVVCGGTNLRDGMLVAFAHIGATVKWHGADLQTLAPVKIRGEESHGMICAAEELDLAEMFPAQPADGERPIADLSALSLKPGASLREALGLTDTVLDINNVAITNRPDLFSHVGFARECVAAGLCTWKKSAPAFVMPKFPKSPMPFRLRVEAKGTVTRYLGCMVEIDATGDTPEWMKRRLIATGFRPLSLPVDITNYVSHEVGMPLHSFDADDIAGDVRLRFSEQGETLTTLDGVEHVLPADALVLTDDRGNFDLLGIMGGLRSSTTEKTRRIYLHSAVIDLSIIRKTTAALNHRTDASTVYEKGIPDITAEWGFARGLQLLLELVPGARITSTTDDLGKVKKPAAIPLDEARVCAVLGKAVTATEMKRTLTALGCTVKAAKKGTLSVTPPPWRTKDLRMAEDLIDDIARHHGYDRLAGNMPLAPLAITPRDRRTNRMRHALAAEGFAEILPLSLISPAMCRNAGVDPAACRALRNPLSEDVSLLQISSLPGLLEHASRSLLHVERSLKTFRITTVFSKSEEHQELGMLCAMRGDASISEEPSLQIADALRTALHPLGYDITIEQCPSTASWMHPGRCAVVRIHGKDGTHDVGHVAELHPDVRARCDLPHRTAVALLHWSGVLALAPLQRKAVVAPAFPAVIYDTTVARSHDEAVGPLLATLQRAHALLESVDVQDIFQPPRDARYRLTLRCTYRAADRTLEEREAKEAHDAVLRAGNLTPLS